MKLGALLLLLALGWFVRYAFANEWIGPIGRITLGMVVGAGIMLTGHLIMPKKRNPGQVIVVLGATMVLLTVFAARMVYDFFTPSLALGIMALVIVAMSVIAIVHTAQSVAYLALFGGFIVPLLTKSLQPDYLMLLVYIFLLNLGVLAVVAIRPWRGLILAGFVGTAIYSLISFVHLPDQTKWIFMALFFGLFLISTLLSVRRSLELLLIDLVITALNGLLLLAWIDLYVPREFASLLLSVIAIFMAVIALVNLKLTKRLKLVVVNLSLAVLFLGTATAFELEGAALTIAYSVETFLVILLTRSLLRKPALVRNVSFLLIVPISLSLKSIEAFSFAKELFNEDFFVLLVMLLTLSGTAWILQTSKELVARNNVMIAAAIYSAIMIWYGDLIIFESPFTAHAVSLFIYTLAGITIFFRGVRDSHQAMTLIGSSILGLVVVRLLLVDVWQMPLSGRVITFFVIGTLLVLTAFFKKRISK